MSSRPGAGGRRRLLIALASPSSLAYRGYLGAANWFLASETGDRVINRKPDKLRIDWSRARSWFPGIVVLDDVTIAGASRAFDWTASLDHVRSCCLSGGCRSRPSTVSRSWATASSSASASTMRSSMSRAPRSRRRARPRHPPPPRVRRLPSKRRKPWHLELDGIPIKDLREISIGQSSLIGRGKLSGGLELRCAARSASTSSRSPSPKRDSCALARPWGRTSRSPSRHPHRRSSPARTRCARSWAACRARPPSPLTSKASLRSTSCSRSPSGCRSPVAAISRASSS